MRSRCRSQTGSLAEFAPVLWFLLMFLTMPLLDLTTIGLRYTFLLGASRDAVQAACLSKTFLADLDAADPSAVNAAQQQAQAHCSSFTGVHLKSVATNLVITNIATGAVSRQSVPLATPADTGTNYYQIEVIVTADVDPLLTYTAGYFGNVPGLTGPARFIVISQQTCESPQGMNQ